MLGRYRAIGTRRLRSETDFTSRGFPAPHSLRRKSAGMRRSPRRYLPYRLRGAPGPSPQRRMPDHCPRASSLPHCIKPGACCQIF